MIHFFINPTQIGSGDIVERFGPKSSDIYNCATIFSLNQTVSNLRAFSVAKGQLRYQEDRDNDSKGDTIGFKTRSYYRGSVSDIYKNKYENE